MSIKKIKSGYAVDGTLTSVQHLFNKIDDDGRYSASVAIADSDKKALQAILKEEGSAAFAGKKFNQTGIFKGEDEKFELSFGKVCVRAKSGNKDFIKLYDARSGKLVPLTSSSEFGLGNEVKLLISFYARDNEASRGGKTLNVSYNGLALMDTGTAVPYGISDSDIADELGLDLADIDDAIDADTADEPKATGQKSTAAVQDTPEDDFDDGGLFD